MIIMSQNVYDRPDFFKAYTDLIDRSEDNLANDGAWSRLHTLVPDVIGLDIIDLGCGSGWFCRWAMNNGAKSVLGIDISEKMLARAQSLTEGRFAGIEYQRADLDTFELSEKHTGKYNLAFSSLALHYLVNLPTLVSLVHRVLKPGALFVFNVEHPIHTAPLKPRVLTDDSGDKYYAFDSYYKEGERTSDWLAPGVKKQHRTLTSYLNIFLTARFDISGFIEWLPTADELTGGKVAEIDLLRPLFLMMSVRKQKE